MDTASSLGVSNIVEKELASSFKGALKSVSKEFPSFGATSGISSEDWWNIVIHRTFKGKLIALFKAFKIFNLVLFSVYGKGS